MSNSRRVRSSRYITRTSEINSVDLDFSFEGDFGIGESFNGNLILSDMEKDELISKEGDIKAVSNKFGRVARNLVIKRLNSVKGDWIFDENCGANIEDFYGANMSRNTMDVLQNQIVQSLTYDGFILNRNLSVEILPITLQEIKIIVIIKNESNENFQLITTNFSAVENRLNKFI